MVRFFLISWYNLHTPWSRVLLEKLNGSQLVNKFPTFYGTRRLITKFTSARHLPILREINPIHALASHFLKFHLNIILPYMPGSYKWSLSLRFPHQNPVYTSPLPHICYMPCPSHPSQLDHLNNIGCGILICVTVDRMCMNEMKSKQDIYCSVFWPYSLHQVL